MRSTYGPTSSDITGFGSSCCSTCPRSRFLANLRLADHPEALTAERGRKQALRSQRHESFRIRPQLIQCTMD